VIAENNDFAEGSPSAYDWIVLETIAVTAWREVHIGIEGDGLQIGGIAIWEHKWRSTGEPGVDLPHPSHSHQIHRYSVCEIGDAGKSIRFATTELSNGVWGFYVPELDNG
jgi:hypothetical protein